MNLTATYQSITIVLLEWIFVNAPGHATKYVVYYQSGGVSYNSSFTRSEETGTFYHLVLPPEGVHSISLVAINQAEGNTVYLPSLVAGPVDPGRLFTIITAFTTFVYHSSSCSSHGECVRRRIRSGWDLILTDMQSQSVQWSGARFS